MVFGEYLNPVLAAVQEWFVQNLKCARLTELWSYTFIMSLQRHLQVRLELQLIIFIIDYRFAGYFYRLSLLNLSSYICDKEKLEKKKLKPANLWHFCL